MPHLKIPDQVIPITTSANHLSRGKNRYPVATENSLLQCKMSAYQNIHYTPFPSSGNHIRTLILHAGEVRDPIQCSLRSITLDNESMYDALSYTWGDPGVTEPIEVDNVEVRVTLNLERALR